MVRNGRSTRFSAHSLWNLELYALCEEQRLAGVLQMQEFSCVQYERAMLRNKSRWTKSPCAPRWQNQPVTIIVNAT